jgi:outer membrane protein insertion porin family
VLRREMLLSEGDLFSRSLLDISMAKVSQLGYWVAHGEPVIEPVEGENRVNITVVGEEQGRNEIQVGGGYSGVDGAFFSGVYSTRNFLGRGQVLSVAMQIGGRQSRYQISFQEPYLFGTRYRGGFSIFRRDADFGATLDSTSKGGGIVMGKRVGRFTEMTLAYSYENVSSTTVLVSGAGLTDPQSITTTNTVSSVTPIYAFSTINNPYRPTRGRSFTTSFQVAGGPLGGNTDFLKPVVTYIAYRPLSRKVYFGMHAQLGVVRAWADSKDAIAADNIEGVPRFQRFWLGGDTLGPRVFETRSITPRRFVIVEDGEIVDVIDDPRDLPIDDIINDGALPVLVETGGDRMYLLQTELVYPFNEQAEMAFWLDLGDSLFDTDPWGFDTVRISAGVELRFHLPIFPVPLRLIYGVPVRKVRGDRTSAFTFSIGRSF